MAPCLMVLYSGILLITQRDHGLQLQTLFMAEGCAYGRSVRGICVGWQHPYLRVGLRNTTPRSPRFQGNPGFGVGMAGSYESTSLKEEE
jgi:hypothetical protein